MSEALQPARDTMGRFVSIRTKALVFSLAFTLIPLVLLGTLNYVQSSRIIREKFSAANQGTIGQIAGRLRFIAADVEDLSLFLVQNESLRGILSRPGPVAPSTVDRPKVQLENSLRALVHSKEYIHSIYVAGRSGTIINPQNTRPQLTPQLVSLANEHPGAPVWVSGVVEDYANARTSVISMVRVMRDVNNITRHLGVIRINVGIPELERILDSTSVGTGGEFLVMHNGETVVSTAVDDVQGSLVAAEIDTADSESNLSHAIFTSSGSRRLLVTYERLDREWLLAHILGVDQLLAEMREMRVVVLAVVGISLVFSAVLALAFLRRIILPVQRLRQLMTRLETGDFDIQASANTNDEIGLLVESFNTMAVRLKDLIHTVYTSQLREREAELEALQSQINPHFLYNTLDALYWVSRLEQAPQTGEIIRALSRLFRYALDTGSGTTTVQQEIQHLESYLVIQRSIHEENVQFALTVDPEVCDAATVKLVLQPLVENALRHGIERSGGRGAVTIGVYADNGCLTYRVEDDGPGADLQRISNLLEHPEQHGSSIGIQNVQQRIRLVHGDSYGMSFATAATGGTVVTVVQPLLQREVSGDPAHGG
jgi:two-component system, sensor histidine kinase YesM